MFMVIGRVQEII